MKLTNIEIISANNGLSELVEEKIKGKLKFKLFKNKVALENKIEAIYQSLEGVVEEKERNEILDEEQEVDVDPLSEADLEELPLSLKQLGSLQPILEGENN